MELIITIVVIMLFLLILSALFGVFPYVCAASGFVIFVFILVKIFTAPRRYKTKPGTKIIDTINTKVAGVTFNGIQSVLPKLHNGMDLRFVREPKNQYDRNAVGVWCGGRKIGHLSADLAANIAPLMDNGTRVDGKISEITGGAGYNYGCNIEIYVYANPQKFTPKPQKAYVTRIINRELPPIKTVEEFAPASVTYVQLPHLYQRSFSVYSLQELLNMADDLKPESYKKRRFSREPKFSREDVEAELRQEATKGIAEGKFLDGDIDQIISGFIDDIVEQRKKDHENWQRDKEIFEAEEAEFAERCNEIYQQNAQTEKNALLDKCNEDAAFITESIKNRLNKLPFPYQYNTKFEYLLPTHTLYLNIDLPQIENIPQEATQKETKFKFVNCAFSISVYTASILFDISAHIECIHLSADTVRRNKDGDAIKECVLAIKYIREKFYGVDYIELDLQPFCMQFENRCNITATGIMKAVKPFEQEIKS